MEVGYVMRHLRDEPKPAPVNSERCFFTPRAGGVVWRLVSGGLRGLRLLSVLSFPDPGQQLRDAAVGPLVGQLGQDVSQIALWINAVEFTGFDYARHN
jgi:hypothetical protein